MLHIFVETVIHYNNNKNNTNFDFKNGKVIFNFLIFQNIFYLKKQTWWAWETSFKSITYFWLVVYRSIYMYILESGLFIFYTIMFVTIINKVNIKCCPSLLMCPYRNTKALCCPTEYFLSDEADQNRPLISETAGVINCVFILGAAESTGLNLARTKISGAAQLNAGRAEPTRVSQSKKTNHDMMKCVRYNTVHYNKSLLPLCVCFNNVKLDFTAKTARFARSRAASAQRPVRSVIHKLHHIEAHTPPAAGNDAY